MFEKFMKEVEAEAALHSSTNADVPTSSQTIAKPNVSRSVLCVVCGAETGLQQTDLDSCDPVCSEVCSDKRRKHFC